MKTTTFESESKKVMNVANAELANKLYERIAGCNVWSEGDWCGRVKGISAGFLARCEEIEDDPTAYTLRFGGSAEASICVCRIPAEEINNILDEERGFYADSGIYKDDGEPDDPCTLIINDHGASWQPTDEEDELEEKWRRIEEAGQDLFESQRQDPWLYE